MTSFEFACKNFEDYFGVTFKDNCKNLFEQFEEKYGKEEVIRAVEIAVEKYETPIDAFQMLGGILCNRQRLARKYLKNIETEEKA